MLSLGENTHPCQQHQHSEMPLVSARLSFLTSLQHLFCSKASPKPGTAIKDFSLFSFSLVPFASRNIPVVLARLFSREKDLIQVALLPLSLPKVYIPADAAGQQCHTQEHWQESLASAPWPELHGTGHGATETTLICMGSVRRHRTHIR